MTELEAIMTHNERMRGYTERLRLMDIEREELRREQMEAARDVSARVAAAQHARSSHVHTENLGLGRPQDEGWHAD